MSVLKVPPKAKLIFSVFSRREELLERTRLILEDLYGPCDFLGPLMPFDYTSYYEPEFGTGLVRQFIGMKNLVEQDALVEVKCQTQEIEVDFSKGGNRTVNIDPGILTAERLVLATGKNFTHRIYLGKGVFADLTLVFRRGTFAALPWTYPDYASEEAISLWNEVRGSYLVHLRRLTSADSR